MRSFCLICRFLFLIVVSATSLAVPAPSQEERPDIVLVMMDDFGLGQFAPHARQIDSRSFDPAFTDFLSRPATSCSI